MNKEEAKQLVERCLPRFPAAGLPQISAESITNVQPRAIATLWARMGNVYDITITHTQGPPINIAAKKVQLPRVCDSIGDQRKKDSYDVEAAFYSEGHAERLIAAGCIVPLPLHVEAARDEGIIICMTKLDGRSRGDNTAFLIWLARLHACYWGARAEEACAQAPGGGLQRQGCYWHLDTRPDEHRKMGNSGWMGRLRLAARAIDMRLKADPLQSICHGDAKGANIMFGSGGEALVYDFQYCGKAAITKDLAYFFNVEAYPSPEEERRMLQLYHQELSRLLESQGDTPPSFDTLKTSLELALCDWRRFTEIGLGGWGDSGATQRVKKVLDALDNGTPLKSEEEYISAMQRAFPV